MHTGETPFCDDDPFLIYEQILTTNVVYPIFYDKNAKSVTKKLLMLDLTRRYGCLKRGCDDIKNCKWYKDFQWGKLIQKHVKAPILPRVENDTDTSNFDIYPEDPNEDIKTDENFEVDGEDPFELF